MSTTDGTVAMDATLVYEFLKTFANTSCKGSHTNTSSNSTCGNISSKSINSIENSTQAGTGELPSTYDFLSDPFETTMALCQLVLCCVIAVGNTLTIIAIHMTPCLKTVQNRYILSLAMSDQLTATALLNLLMKNYVLVGNHFHSCQYDIASLYTTICVSLLNMLSIAVDRYIYIVHPFVHMRQVTGRRTNIIIASQWIFAVLSSFPPVYITLEQNEMACNPFYAMNHQVKGIAYAHTANYFVVCSGIGIMYGLIARVAKQRMDKKNKRIQATDIAIKSLGKTRQDSEEMEQNLSQTEPASPHNDDVISRDKNSSRNTLFSQKSTDIPSTGDSIEIRPNAHVTSDSVVECGKNSQTARHNGQAPNNNSAEKIPERMIHEKAQYPLKSSEKFVSSSTTSEEQNSQRYAQKQKLGPKGGDSSVNGTKQTSENQSSSASNVGLSLSSLRWMKQMLIVFGLFAMCWTPSMTCTVLSMFRQLDYKTVYVLSMFGVSNSAANFFIYAVYNRQFRSAVKEKFYVCCCSCCRWRR